LTVLEALRVHQWSKNLLLFVPLFVGHAFGDVGKIVQVSIGFAILCVLSSATYLVNDMADVETDRRHAKKRYRPFASGRLPLRSGSRPPHS
jgi:4-hydroxybenzoate polyprenyltransferase